MSAKPDEAGDEGQTGELAPPPGRKPDLEPHAPPMDPAKGQTGELAAPPTNKGAGVAD